MRRWLHRQLGLRRGILFAVVLLISGVTVITASYALSASNEQQSTISQAPLAQPLQPRPARTPPPLPPRKQRIQDEFNARRSASSATPPSLSAIPTPPPFSGEPWPQGIIEDVQVPYPQALYIVTNAYQVDRGREHVQVFAGADREDPAQGLVIVRVTPFDLSNATTNVYRTPIKTGTLRAVSATGDRVTLTTAGGTTFVFDIAARRFI